MTATCKQRERIPVQIYADDKRASQAVARRIARLIRSKAARGESTVLGLATGHTPVNVYRELIRMHRAEGLDLAGVVTFNLDEYWPIEPTTLQSYHHWMHANLFDAVNIKPENIHLLSGTVRQKDIGDHCRQYEEHIRAAGGIDLQILGVGRSGHIGFNEPGSSPESLTRRIELDTITRKDAANDFFGEETVPQNALTMGVKTILAAREICLLAFGEHKAPIVKRAVEGPVSAEAACSYLQNHPRATMYLDAAAAAELTRISTPWLVDSCGWDEYLKRHAVIWLAQKLDKPILKLTDEDYAENGLVELLRACGGSYRLNIDIFRHQMNTITGWPGGKGQHRRVLVFSPHPDDDVICMGGTMARFAEQGHELHVAYMVSGCLSVFDHAVSRYGDFVREFNHIFGLTPEQTKTIEEHIDQFLRQKKPGDVDTPEVQAIKGLIRRTEAIDAAKYCGVAEERTHFLNLPFYNTGKVQKLRIGPEDIAAVQQTLDRIRPDMIFAAGDLSDPHGTHRLCLEALLVALEAHAPTCQTPPEIWLYRGAWQEWPPEQIDMAVPLAPDELKRKRFAIFRHESQKDRAMFPGPYDSREFWQRAEERNMTTAAIYDALGLPEYHALEAFVRYPPRSSDYLLEQLDGPNGQEETENES
ncbi:MAG: glucosamine-6-phosphate deaminase [Sedimentisphaerales bacterium]|nr:glucosamine-6-phosphate deaminase [Sedimentisphaerales bacterium]